jgi:hypothetical protein
MERLAFCITLCAGFLTCALLAYRGYHGAAADWVFGFCCLLWSFLMLARVAALTAPALLQKDRGHLARRVLNALYARDQAAREGVLQQTFGPSFLTVLALGLAYAGWNLLCLFLPDGRESMFALSQSINAFFAGSARAPDPMPSLLFDWTHGFLVILTLTMMGFVLRSFMQQMALLRAALLIVSGYIVAGGITLIALHGSLLDGLGIIPTSPPSGWVGTGPALWPSSAPISLMHITLGESGLIGWVLCVLLLATPLVSLWAGLQKNGLDWVLGAGGTLGACALALGLFLPLSPALGGYLILCAMSVFLAWGGANRLAL